MMLSQTSLKRGLQHNSFGDAKPFVRGAPIGRSFRQVSKTMAETNGAPNGASANGQVVQISAVPVLLRSNIGECLASRTSCHKCGSLWLESLGHGWRQFTLYSSECSDVYIGPHPQ